MDAMQIIEIVIAFVEMALVVLAICAVWKAYQYARYRRYPFGGSIILLIVLVASVVLGIWYMNQVVAHVHAWISLMVAAGILTVLAVRELSRWLIHYRKRKKFFETSSGLTREEERKLIKDIRDTDYEEREWELKRELGKHLNNIDAV